MEIMYQEEQYVDKSDVFNVEYGVREFVLPSPGSLSSLDKNIGMTQFSVSARSENLEKLIDKLPHAGGVGCSLMLPHLQGRNLIPVAVLVKSISNNYPFTLQWQLSGCDHPFVQVQDHIQQSGWLSMNWFGRQQQRQEGKPRKYFWNLATKFFGFNSDYMGVSRCNSAAFLGFDGKAFRQNTPQAIQGEQRYYLISHDYKYYAALRHAFMHVHANTKEFRVLLQHSEKLWRIETNAMEKVLCWIETECVLQESELRVSANNIRVFIEKYDASGWHVLSESDKSTPRDRPLLAEIGVILLYKLVDTAGPGTRTGT